MSRFHQVQYIRADRDRSPGTTGPSVVVSGSNEMGCAVGEWWIGDVRFYVQIKKIFHHREPSPRPDRVRQVGVWLATTESGPRGRGTSHVQYNTSRAPWQATYLGKMLRMILFHVWRGPWNWPLEPSGGHWRRAQLGICTCERPSRKISLEEMCSQPEKSVV